MPRSGEESYLALLLRRRVELERMATALADAADRARPAPKEALSPTMRKQLRSLRLAASRASQALERLEWVIADTPAETIGDVLLKLRLCAELQGYSGVTSSGWREAFTVEEQLLRILMADLKRLMSREEHGRSS
jgi:hypothetical protein